MKRKISIFIQIILLLLVFASLVIHIYESTDPLKTLFKFTILSNVAVVIALILNLKNVIRNKHDDNFTLSFKNAVLIWILVTGVVNHLLLSADQYSGISVYTEFVLHYIAPIGYFIIWIFFEEKHKLKYINLLYWLAFPLLFSIGWLISGYFDGYYPYFFLNPVDSMPEGVGSYLNVGIYIGIISIIFSLVGLFVVFINRKFSVKW